MKILLLTFSKAFNFGANLQCYALSRILSELGHNVVIIDFPLKNKYKTSFLRSISTIIRGMQLKSFRDKYMPVFTSVQYNNSLELISCPPIADCYIVGSDQVWNPDITVDFFKSYFLDFAPSTSKRIAYAASFGNNNWTKTENVDEIRNLLKKFNTIGVREETGISILHQVFGIHATRVLDPTLLLTQYDELLPISEPQNLTLISFRYGYYDTQYFNKLLKFSQVLNLKPVLLNHKWYRSGFKYSGFTSVKGWLKAISSSSFVITDSYHCMIFSIIFKKDFIIIPSNPSRISRVTDLLLLLGLQDRFFNTIDDVDQTQNWRKPIDYNNVYKKLEIERSKSISFLRNALER